jgi:hypothetical protein
MPTTLTFTAEVDDALAAKLRDLGRRSFDLATIFDDDGTEIIDYMEVKLTDPAGVTLSFPGESCEVAARLLNTPYYPGIGINGWTADLDDGSTVEIVGANQREDEDEIKVVVRRYDIEAGEAVGPELRLPWDTHLSIN